MCVSNEQGRARTPARQEKENILKSQPVIRAAVRMVPATALLAGAGWFTNRPVAGQETKQQTLRGAAALGRLKMILATSNFRFLFRLYR